MPRSDAAKTLRAAQAATGRSQVRFAIDVLGVNDRSYRGWIRRDQPEPAWPPVVRLAWLIARHPALAEELAAEYPTGR